jgi:DNA end-binding protein Ku
MVAIARAIIRQRTGSFDPTTYRDRYQEALRELIEAKMKGLTVKPRKMAAPPPVIRRDRRAEASIQWRDAAAVS